MNVTFKCISFVKNSTMERDFKHFVQNIKWAMSALKSSTENIKIFSTCAPLTVSNSKHF